MTICLAAIVRNEAAIIGRCLDSCRGLIDQAVIVDTGSTDGTKEAVMDSVHGDFSVNWHERPWVNFGHNRTELMELARGTADWLLLLDADMTIEAVGGLRPHPLAGLDADAYMIRHEGNPSYWIKRLVRGDLPWRYVGATHEYLDGPPHRTERLDSIVVKHFYDGSTRPEKFQRDYELLKQEYGEDPGNTRTVFYLGNTLRDLGMPDLAAEMYRERAQMGGWEEEVYESLYQAAVLTDDVTGLLVAWSRRPTRAEPLYEAAWRLRRQEAYEAAFLIAQRGADIPLPSDTLFLAPWVYEWGCLFELSIAAYWTGRRDLSLLICDRLLDVPTLPDSYRAQVEHNRSFCRV